jgi:hypothetical protein
MGAPQPDQRREASAVLKARTSNGWRHKTEMSDPSIMMQVSWFVA